MAIASSLQSFLSSRGVPYDIVPHMPTMHSASTARAAHIPRSELAKGVLLKYSNGYVLAIVPASCEVRLDVVAAMFERQMGLATESEIAALFTDCDRGAVPPVSPAYGIEAVIDERLEALDDIYLEGGDHRSLVHLKGRDFTEMMAQVPHGDIGAPLH